MYYMIDKNLNKTHHYFRTPSKQIATRFIKNKCCVSGKRNNLTVHHIVPYAVLLHEAFDKANVRFKKYIKDLSQEEINAVLQQLIFLHKEEDVVTITKPIHKKFHELYSCRATKEDWILFTKHFKARRR